MRDSWKMQPGFLVHNGKGAVREVVRIIPGTPDTAKNRKVEWKSAGPNGQITSTCGWYTFTNWASEEYLEPRPERLPVPILTDAYLAFPIGEHTPPWRWVPEEFSTCPGGTSENLNDPWVICVSSLWMGDHNWNEWQAIPKDGVDPKHAHRAILATLGSWNAKHEHKMATAAYMMSEWFEDFWWKGDRYSAVHGYLLSEAIGGS